MAAGPPGFSRFTGVLAFCYSAPRTLAGFQGVASTWDGPPHFRPDKKARKAPTKAAWLSPQPPSLSHYTSTFSPSYPAGRVHLLRHFALLRRPEATWLVDRTRTARARDTAAEAPGGTRRSSGLTSRREEGGERALSVCNSRASPCFRMMSHTDISIYNYSVTSGVYGLCKVLFSFGPRGAVLDGPGQSLKSSN
jgi:hypothetical protein